ncbi:MAG TPA: DedA family protein [Candidatus Saccharimonadales bacterium]|jgi:membrane-associated protein|nr:DedA family protein [Candidatus Saccharimonadales bacterium]
MKLLYKAGITVVGLAVVFVVLQKVVSVDKIFQASGILGLGLTIFAETGLLAGFFLPGDTLLFAAGFFAAQGRLNLALCLFVLYIGAVAGNMVGYEIGKRSGHKLFKKTDSILFHKDNIEKAQDFFTKHGGKTIILARFVPIVRTLSSPLAGMGHMPYGKFMLYNLIGAALWIPSITLIGYWAGKVLGHYINIDHYILPAALLATVATFGISFAHILRDPISRQRLKAKIRLLLERN